VSSTKALRSSADEVPTEAERLQKQAEKLRMEVELFEAEKNAARIAERAKFEEEEAAKLATRQRFSALVPILKPDGSTVEERCDFKPKLGTDSFITTFEVNLPLGIILSEDDQIPGTVKVDVIADESNAKVAGLRVGDIIRACTACRMEMERPTWQLMIGGIGVPRTKRFMYSVDDRPFEEVLEAIASNRMDPDQRPMLLVVERRE
jgi:hypothetical protein